MPDSEQSDSDSRRDSRPRREHDTRASRLRNLLEELLGMGVVPRVLELDGLHLEVGAYSPPDGRPQQQNPGVLGRDELAARRQEANVRGYRQRNREELARALHDERDKR